MTGRKRFNGLQVCSNVSNAPHEVEGDQQQELLGVSLHAQQVVLSEITIHKRQQVALDVVGSELRDHLLDEA
ncbi:hypothetical protein ACSFBM_28210 [Variovorax sp. GB1R11]|uniref:hypothetical protein n=1 Tax=Variovorax sp. GB1R11 TaxID=3443741 RepID=UPI003F4686FF